MGRAARSPPAISSLPKVVFEKIEDDLLTQPAGVHDLQARSYGYNDFSDFTRPDHYIRHIEPLEIDLARQVEYDMDEQDQEWLDAVNAERRKEHMDKISYELFEIIMDRLEKEWFYLTKNIPKSDFALPSEDSTCAICDDSEGENSNAIVFCDGCNLAVHQDCYGVPYIPEGQWLCRKCTVSPENPVQCILCPNEGGAFKQTTHGDWVHLLCAIWVPETRVINEVFMEPIAGVEKISRQRWKLRCSICDIREGACIQCAKASCFLAFHATCARKEKLLLPMKSTQGSEPMTLTCYCERHLPKEQQEARATALSAEASQADEDTNAKSNKSARAYAKTYHPGPPLVPALIVNRIMQYITKVNVRKKAEFVLLLCRYWSLKREARRGAPLLKRLHLEPWSAAVGARVRTEEEKVMKLEQLHRLREDLIRLRNLTEFCRKRESRKYKQAEIIYDVIAKAFFPYQDSMRRIFDRIVSLDKQEFFRSPVSKQLVPDYYDIVKRPMCWNMIEAKLDHHGYWDVQSFKDDVELVLDNALLYNKPESPISKAALRLKKNVQALYEELDKERVIVPDATSFASNSQLHPVVLDPMDVDEPTTLSRTTQYQDAKIGDLEPPLEVLDLLVSSTLIKSDLNIVLQNEPLESLLNFELAIFKPPPTPPPPAPKQKKPKRDRKAEYERAKAKKAAAAAAAMATAAEALTMLNGTYPVPMGNMQWTSPSEGLNLEPMHKITMGPQILQPTRPTISTQDLNHDLEISSTPESSLATPSNERMPRKKRPSITLPGQSEIPPMVSDVDNRDSFKMFDAGWILPPEQKRGGRPPVDRSVLPPPRKRARTEQGTSRLSVISTTASENQTLQTSPHQGSVPPLSSVSSLPSQLQPPTADTTSSALEAKIEALAIAENAQNDAIDGAPSRPALPTLPSPTLIPSTLDLSSMPAPTKVIEAPNGTIIIEELDTPAIRRAKYQKRREEKEKLRRDFLAGGASNLLDSKGKKPVRDADSELSSLSEFGSELTEDSGKQKPKKRGRRRKKGSQTPLFLKSEDDLARVSLGEGEMLEGGTLVWAKADSFPWWPAVIFEDDDPDVPLNISQQCREARQKRKAKLHILRFFDKNQSWQYLPVDRLKLLGEDPEFDEDMQAVNSRRQRWKTAIVRRECCDAYKRALAEMETGSDGDGALKSS